MGCDIHSMVEVYRPRYQGGGFARPEVADGVPWEPKSSRWVALDNDDGGIFRNTWHDPNSKQEYFRNLPKMTSVPFDDRNYMLFALLADVRNGRGFAGVYTHDPIEPLSEPRGVPRDASFGWLETVDSWDVDMHSHSYFTLEELIAFRDAGKLGQHVRRGGAITGLEYERIQREGGKPESWCGSVSGGGIITITPDEYDAGVRAPTYSPEHIAETRAAWETGAAKGGWTEALEKRFAELTTVEGRTYVQYVWEDKLYENAGIYVDRVIEGLIRYAKDLAPDDGDNHVYNGKDFDTEPGYHGHGGIPYNHIRVVFGFDN